MDSTVIVESKRLRVQSKVSFFELFCGAILICGAVSMLLPFFWMLLASLKTNAEFYNSFKWFPEHLRWSNYQELLFPKQGYAFIHYFYNTVKVTLLSVIGMILSCSLIAFALARIDFPGKNVIFTLAIMSMFLPTQVTMIPQFIIFKQLNWLGTHYPLIVPSFFGGAFGIVLMRQYYLSIPKELDEAAKIDGCGWFHIYTKIHLPLVISPMITLAILTFQEKWAELLSPMIYVGRNQELWTMVLKIKDISTGQYNSRPELEMAGDVMLVLPVVLLFIFAQKYFTQSITADGIKG